MPNISIGLDFIAVVTNEKMSLNSQDSEVCPCR